MEGTGTGEWGASNFRKTFRIGLYDVIAEFPPSLKQAMYAAANKGIIHRHTWNDCGLNAAGKELNIQGVASFEKASRAFGITVAQAKWFVKLWDGMQGSDELCTETLKDTILRVGLFTEPGKLEPRIIRKRVFESQVKVDAEFEKIVEANEVPYTEEASELLQLIGSGVD